MTLATAHQTLKASVLTYLTLHTCHTVHGVGIYQSVDQTKK